jgi:hypothetical protein
VVEAFVAAFAITGVAAVEWQKWHIIAEESLALNGLGCLATAVTVADHLNTAVVIIFIGAFAFLCCLRTSLSGQTRK